MNTSAQNSLPDNLDGDLDVPVAKRKAARIRRLPARYRPEDTLPQALPPVEEVEEETVCETAIQEPRRVAGPRQPLVVHKSKRNAFGVVRAYHLLRGSLLTHDPDRVSTLRDLTDFTPDPPVASSTLSTNSQFGPFPSRSAFSLADWYWSSSNKSFKDFQQLISLLQQPDFCLTDTLRLDWRSAFRALGANREDIPEHEGGWIQDDGWKTTPITIDVPLHHRTRKPGCDSYTAGSFHHRSIVSVIKEKIANSKDSPSFHYQPYQATWKPNDSDAAPEVELHGELYCSQAFRDAHEKVQALPITDRNEGLERVVVGMMFWTDGTQLTSFGGASLWPCYLFFGNESKYRRAQPSNHLGEQIAYFMKIPDEFDDYLRKRNDGKLPTDGLYAHCARELFQKQWGIMLDDELLDAMKHGLVILCPDGRRRCFYPRIFTTLVAGLRNNGGCPCHRCLVAKDDLRKLGAPNDTERHDQKRSEQEQIKLVDLAKEEIKAGFAVDGTRIDAHLKAQSLVPVHNAFAARLAQLAFEIIPALAVDLLHEFEIGVWKKLFIHLIRLLEAFAALNPQGSTLTAMLDYRYRLMSSFGRDAIRKFSKNASEMKRKAARDYEDLLQCAIPAFESLLPEPHNSILMKLLYICAQWHALAKLRLHHDITLEFLDCTTTLLGAQMRLFAHQTCSKVATKELQREADARAKREGKGKLKGRSGRKPATFGMFTIKFHFLGDYVAHIRHFGTTDSFSTETGELFHRLPKSWFDRTDKRKYEGQLSQIERRQARLDQIRHAMTQKNTTASNSEESELVVEADSPPSADERAKKLVNKKGKASAAPSSNGGARHDVLHELEFEDSPDRRYTLGANKNDWLDLRFFSHNPTIPHRDPYLINFHQSLKEHLFPRIVSKLGFSEDIFAEEDWLNVSLPRIYVHKLMRVNFTTYDVRRDQDIVHIDTPQSHIMLLNDAFTQNPGSPGSTHPYLYAKILKICHADVSYVGLLPDGTRNETAHRLDFLWVHWYDFHRSKDQFSLDQVSLQPPSSDLALGFLNPSDIVRCVHLIPNFSLGPSECKAPPSKCFPKQKEDTWKSYYVNRFADRDMFMRYQYGMGVGHTYMRKNWPSPAAPSIPPDFDHHLSFPEGDTAEIVPEDDFPTPGEYHEAEDSEGDTGGSDFPGLPQPGTPEGDANSESDGESESDEDMDEGEGVDDEADEDVDEDDEADDED